MSTTRPLAVITGASTGIGYELAKCCAQEGFDLLIAADEPEIENAATTLRELGINVEALEADLATLEGVDKLYEAIKDRPVHALLANAGRGLGRAFLEQKVDAWKRVVDTNITGTIYLVQKIAQDMCSVGLGRILITGSIAGFVPGTLSSCLQWHQSLSGLVFLCLTSRAQRIGHYGNMPYAGCDRDGIFLNALT